MKTSNQTRVYTGEVRFRTGLRGALILQVQVIDGTGKEWVDARTEDVTRQKIPGVKP